MVIFAICRLKTWILYLVIFIAKAQSQITHALYTQVVELQC